MPRNEDTQYQLFLAFAKKELSFLLDQYPKKIVNWFYSTEEYRCCHRFVSDISHIPISYNFHEVYFYEKEIRRTLDKKHSIPDKDCLDKTLSDFPFHIDNQLSFRQKYLLWRTIVELIYCKRNNNNAYAAILQHIAENLFGTILHQYQREFLSYIAQVYRHVNETINDSFLNVSRWNYCYVWQGRKGFVQLILNGKEAAHAYTTGTKYAYRLVSKTPFNYSVFAKDEYEKVCEDPGVDCALPFFFPWRDRAYEFCDLSLMLRELTEKYTPKLANDVPLHYFKFTKPNSHLKPYHENGIWKHICRFLPEKDLAHLRMSCRFFFNSIPAMQVNYSAKPRVATKIFEREEYNCRALCISQLVAKDTEGRNLVINFLSSSNDAIDIYDLSNQCLLSSKEVDTWEVEELWNTVRRDRQFLPSGLIVSGIDTTKLTIHDPSTEEIMNVIETPDKITSFIVLNKNSIAYSVAGSTEIVILHFPHTKPIQNNHAEPKGKEPLVEKRFTLST